MGRGNARFGCPKGTYRINDHSALHCHVYVDYGHLNEQEEIDNLKLEIANHVKAVCSTYPFFEFPEGKWLDGDILILAESTHYGVAVCDNEWSEAVFVYAKEFDTTEDFLTQGVLNLSCHLFWEMRYMTLRQRSCAWTSKAYQGRPVST